MARKRGAQKSAKRTWRRRNIIFVGFLLACALISLLYTDRQATRKAPTRTHEAIVNATQSAAETAIATLWTQTYTPLPSNTPLPTNTSLPTNTPTPTPLPAGTTYYAYGLANARDCPQLDCPILVELQRGSQVQVIDTVQGAAVNGDTRWYRARRGDQVLYVHTSLLHETPPPAAQPAQPAIQQATPIRRPANCDEAIAMGLTAQQAAQWPHLDRDGDGVACYGD